MRATPLCVVFLPVTEALAMTDDDADGDQGMDEFCAWTPADMATATSAAPRVDEGDVARIFDERRRG